MHIDALATLIRPRSSAKHTARFWLLYETLTLALVLAIAVVLAQLAYGRPRQIQITPTDSSAAVSRSGFYDPEFFHDTGQPYRWTSDQARLTFPNPGGDLMVSLLLAGGPQRQAAAEIEVSGATARIEVAPTQRSYLLRFPRAEASQVDLHIRATPWIEQSGGRSLGIVVGSAVIRGSGAVPLALLRTILLTVFGAYALLRALLWRRIAAALVLASLAAFFVWLIQGGWGSSNVAGVAALGGAVLVMLVASVRAPVLLRDGSLQRASMRFRPLTRLYDWSIQRAAVKIGLLLLLAPFAISLLFLRIRTQFGVADLGLDVSWFLELENQLRQGNLMGRDTYFTYGPLSQQIMSLGALLRGGGPVLNGFATGYFMFEVTAVTLFTLAILLLREVRWPGALLLFCVGFVLDGVMNMRQSMAILSMVLLVRTLDAPPIRRRWLSVLAGCTCFAAQLLTAEVGVYATVAGLGLLCLLILLTLLPLERVGLTLPLRPWRVYAEVFALCFGAIVLMNGLLELYFQASSAVYQPFDYLRYTGAILTEYNYTMGSPWSLAREPSLLLLALVMFCGLALLAQLRRAPTARVHLLLGLGIVAALNMKSALVRSDLGHIIMACSPLIFLFVTLICLSGWGAATRYLGLGLLGLTLLFWPSNQLSYVVHQLERAADGTLSLRAHWQAIRATSVNPELIAPAELRQAIDPAKQVVNFPFDNVIALALGQRSLAPVLQTYSAHNLALQEHYVGELERQRQSIEVVYGMDGVVVGRLDGVQNVSRAPRIFQYLIEHFELKSPTRYRNGYVVLRPRAEPAPLQSSELAFRVEQDDMGQTVVLNAPATCALVDIELTMRYPLIALFGRPRGLEVEVRSGEATVLKSGVVAVEHTKPFHTYLYLGKSDQFYQLFGSTSSPETAATFNQIRLTPPPASIFDVRAEDVQVSSLHCVPAP